MKTLSSFLLSFAVLALPVYAADTKGQWTGFVTDTHCGAKLANADHSDACVEKCLKNGSKVHLVDEVDQKMYDLDDYSKVKGLVGKRITVKGNLDTEKNTITVESAAPAKEKEKATK
jgi:hypothetical protein